MLGNNLMNTGNKPKRFDELHYVPKTTKLIVTNNKSALSGEFSLSAPEPSFYCHAKHSPAFTLQKLDNGQNKFAEDVILVAKSNSNPNLIDIKFECGQTLQIKNGECSSKVVLVFRNEKGTEDFVSFDQYPLVVINDNTVKTYKNDPSNEGIENLNTKTLVA